MVHEVNHALGIKVRGRKRSQKMGTQTQSQYLTLKILRKGILFSYGVI